jgi:plasmid replication initiation protein
MGLENKIVTTYENGIIYKSNELIESCYNLTTAQNRLIYLAMTKLNTTILEKNLNIAEVEDRIQTARFELMFISVLDYKKTFNIKSNNLYSELARIATDLYNEEILYIKPNGDFGRNRWVTTCEYDHEGKGIALEFHPKMIRHLLIFTTEYTGMFFEQFANKLRGKYSFRIYELCKQYTKIGKRNFDVDDLRFKLSLMDDEYKEYRDFKKMILSAIKEINKNTDIFLEYKEIEKNRTTKKVLKIQFSIILQNQQLILGESEGVDVTHTTKNQVKIISELINHKVTAQQSRDIITTALTAIDTHEDLKESKIGIRDYISQKVDVCEEYIKQKGTKDYIGLLLTALEKNYQKKIVIPAQKKENVKEIPIDIIKPKNYLLIILNQENMIMINLKQDY